MAKSASPLGYANSCQERDVSTAERKNRIVVEVADVGVVLIVPLATTLAIVLSKEKLLLPGIVDANVCISMVVKCKDLITTIGN